MMKSSEEAVLKAFERVHGQMTGSCYAELMYDHNYDIIGVACMKNGEVAWMTSLAELNFDLMACAVLNL